MRGAAIVYLSLPWILGACGTLRERDRESTPPPADPNPSTVIVTQDEPRPLPGNAIVDENEELRELLSAALTAQKAAEAEREAERARAAHAEQQLSELRAVEADLRKRLETETGRATALQRQVEQQKLERNALAEMYAAEKHQRLVFEKELLEHEIASRTHADRKDPR